MSHSQFHCTGRAYLDMHGLIFETSICYWQDQPGRKRERSREGTGGGERETRERAGGRRTHARARPNGAERAERERERPDHPDGGPAPVRTRKAPGRAGERNQRLPDTLHASSLPHTPLPRGIGRAGTVAHTGRGAGWVARAGGRRSDRRRSPARKATSPRATTGVMKRGPGGRATAGAEPGRPPVETRRRPRRAAARQTRSRRDTRQGLLGRGAQPHRRMRRGLTGGRGRGGPPQAHGSEAQRRGNGNPPTRPSGAGKPVNGRERPHQRGTGEN